MAMEKTLPRTNKKLRRVAYEKDNSAWTDISENLKTQIRGMRQATRNANDAISLIQTAESGLSVISNIIIRLRELAIQTVSNTIGDRKRSFTSIEFQDLKNEIDRVSKSTEFNGVKLLDGTGGEFEFQVEISNNSTQGRLKYDGKKGNATLKALGLTSLEVTSKERVQSSLKDLDNALVQINGIKAGMDALQNRLSSAITNLAINDKNLRRVKSRIQDIHIATETAETAKSSIFVHSGTSVFSQTFKFPNIVLKLVG